VSRGVVVEVTGQSLDTLSRNCCGGTEETRGNCHLWMPRSRVSVGA
jgi:hypothetical protein